MTADNFALWREAIGGRRFIMTMGCGFANTALFAYFNLSEGGYVTLTMATVAVYVAGNLTQRIKAPDTK